MQLGTRQETRRTEAKARQDAASKRSPEAQLARLDEMLGKGQGAQKERAKLTARIEMAAVKAAAAQAEAEKQAAKPKKAKKN